MILHWDPTYSSQGCIVSVLTSRSRDAISNVSVSHHMVSFTSRPIYIFIMFTLTLERVQFYISFIQFIKHFPYARSLEGVALTFYVFNEIRFAPLWSITTHLTSISKKLFTLLLFFSLCISRKGIIQLVKNGLNIDDVIYLWPTNLMLTYLNLCERT